MLEVSRGGVLRETTEENGAVVAGGATDENAMRAFWRHYKNLMLEGR